MHHTVGVRRPTARLAVLALTLALPVLGACSSDGREMAEPGPNQTTTTTGPPTLDAADGGLAGVFGLHTTATDDGGELPVQFTCFGDRLSPPLDWANVPAGAVQLAIVVRDRDNGGYVHWLVTGIDPSTQGFGEGGLPEVAVEQVNSTGAVGWLPPCPPQGGDRHVYDVVLHVLYAPLSIDPALPAAEAAAQVESASQEEAPLAVTVTPPATGVGSVED